MTELWAKAMENAQAARLLMQHDHFNVAGARAYYAMFTAARVLRSELASVDLETIKRHATVIRLFSLHFVQTGAFGAALAKEFRRSSAARGTADYDETSIGRKEAMELIATMDRFLARAETLRKEKSKS